ncbi:MAG: histidine phosphatase family protein [Candidatus Poribacteria bacterium]|nr:histidine phosphatase family protein [Candidatus Poribacteria bacterium]MDE0504972.1 histidine phosphatase family protein [Candidatus Poribacteria bacterium]
MKTLLILRHAKSSWKDEGVLDHDRPLNKRGKRDAPRVGELLLHQGLIPDLIVSSTAKRARSTAKRVAKACRYAGEIQLTSQFYHAPAGSYIEYLNHLPDEYSRVMVVGHNPGMEELVARLGQNCTMPTAALANLSLPIDCWSELDGATEGRLVQVWYPRDLS